MASSRAARAREKENRVVAMRLEGHDFEMIASKVGYRGRSGAWKAYQRALARRSDAEGVDFDADVRLELARLDELQASIYEAARRGDLAAHDRVLKIMKHRDRLKGYAVSPRGVGGRPPAVPATGDGVVVERTVLDDLREKRRAGQ